MQSDTAELLVHITTIQTGKLTAFLVQAVQHTCKIYLFSPTIYS